MALILERLKKDVSLVIGTKEHALGSQEHLNLLHKTLMGLELIRDCYEKGSAPRLIFSLAVAKLRRIIQALEVG